MRFLNTDLDQRVTNVTAYLTIEEVRQLHSYLTDLLDDTAQDHVHFSDETFENELTIAVVTSENMAGFDERSVKLLRE